VLINGLPTIFSTWLDYKLKELLPLVQTYIKSSYQVIDDLTNLVFPSTAKLFSADVTSMYTNMDMHTGINAKQNFLSDNAALIPDSFPTALFQEILQIVMENNRFCFADLFWLQLSGMAIRTPVAGAYTTVSYGQHENTKILPRFLSNLIYLERYIDDIFGIWLPSTTNDAHNWEEFKTALDDLGSLQWVIKEPSTSTNILDLNIQIKGASLKFSTFQSQ
jgi:hypothetical protein